MFANIGNAMLEGVALIGSDLATAGEELFMRPHETRAQIIEEVKTLPHDISVSFGNGPDLYPEFNNPSEYYSDQRLWIPKYPTGADVDHIINQAEELMEQDVAEEYRRLESETHERNLRRMRRIRTAAVVGAAGATAILGAVKLQEMNRNALRGKLTEEEKEQRRKTKERKKQRIRDKLAKEPEDRQKRAYF
jgi:hypothetical protein